MRYLLVLRVLLKAIDKNRLFKVNKYVKHSDGKVHIQGYWVAPPSTPDSRKLRKTISLAEQWCLSQEKKHPGREFGVVVAINGDVLARITGSDGRIDLDKYAHFLKGSIFIHNHPSGASFSFEDIKTYFTHEIFEMRAVSYNKRYIFRAVTHAWVNVYRAYLLAYSKSNSQEKAMNEVGKEKGVVYVK